MSNYRSRRNSGFLMVMLLFVIVVGLLFYYKMAGGDRMPDDSAGVDITAGSSLPWEFEDCIGSGLNRPLNDSQMRPENKQITVAVRDKEGNQPRGRVTIAIAEDGKVFAGWSGTYKKNQNIEYDIVMASTEGNIDPTIAYVDMDNKEDTSLLYFITKGKFMFLRTENGKITRPGGELFITGFFRPDGSIFGKVHLTSDRTKQTVFDFGKEYQ